MNEKILSGVMSRGEVAKMEWRRTFTLRDLVVAPRCTLDFIQWQYWALLGVSGWTKAYRDFEGTLIFERWTKEKKP